MSVFERFLSSMPFMFTAENAAEYGRKGAEATKAVHAARKLAPPPSPDPLETVRKQLAWLNERILREQNPDKLKRLFETQAIAFETERVLAGRSLPPIIRGSTARPARPPEPDAMPL